MSSWLLGGSWVAINGVIIKVNILISHIRGLITPLATTHEHPSRGGRTSVFVMGEARM